MLNEELNEETTQPTRESLSEEVKAVENTVFTDETLDQEEPEESTYVMDVEHEEEQDLSSLGKEQLVELVEKASKSEDLKEASRLAKEVKSILDALFAEEEQTALDAFIEGGNEKDDFQAKPNEWKTRFFEAYRHIQSRKSDQRNRIEEEKLKNLTAKRRILENLKTLTEGDESADALDKVKELQNEWKKIRVVPHENVQELWDSYRVLMDMFYDNLSINFELKELDRKKNLEAKIDLCMKVDQLQNEPSVKVAMNMLNKYHDEWKHTGPVPKEYSEEIWTRFKAASDKVYELKKGQMEELKEKRKKNLELKTAIAEKLEQVATVLYEKPKEWIAKTQEINGLFDEWKKIGPVPKEDNEQIWNRFKDLRNHFYRQKNNFFKHLNKEKSENLALKEALCAKAEGLRDSDDWNKTTNELIRLQGEWKKVGPVPEKQSDEVWKRFRTACDSFFNRKEEHFKGQKQEQEGSLEAKRALIERVKALNASEKADEIFKELKEIQKAWSSAGFVPIKFKNDIQKEYSELIDALYKKHKRNVEDMKENQVKEHMEELATLPDGAKRLQMEERKIKERMRFLKNDVETLENNIGFFSNSKTAGPLIQGIREKIDKANEQMERLQRELNAIKKLY